MDAFPTDATHVQHNHEDALYVLGVAGLASKKLLQKHHIPIAEASSIPNNEQVQQDASSSFKDGKSKAIDVGFTAIPSTPLTETFVQAFLRVSKSRKAFIRYQSSRIRAAFLLLIRGPIQMIRSFWKFGGGKDNIAKTVSITIASVYIVFRMVAYVIANEGMNLPHGGA